MFCGFNAASVVFPVSATDGGIVVVPGGDVDAPAGASEDEVALEDVVPPIVTHTLVEPALMPNELPPYQTTAPPVVIVVGLGCHG